MNKCMHSCVLYFHVQPHACVLFTPDGDYSRGEHSFAYLPLHDKDSISTGCAFWTENTTIGLCLPSRLWFLKCTIHTLTSRGCSTLNTCSTLSTERADSTAKSRSNTTVWKCVQQNKSIATACKAMKQHIMFFTSSFPTLHQALFRNYNLRWWFCWTPKNMPYMDEYRRLRITFLLM